MLIVRVEVPEALVTEDGLNLQVGGSVVSAEPFSVMLPHVSDTLCLNPPPDVIVTVVVDAPPAVTDAGEGAGAEIVKPGAAAPMPDKAIFCGLPEALSVIVTLPARPPVAVGANVTEIWQLPPAARDVLQVFVSPKSPEAAIPVMLSALLPVLVKVTIWGVLVVPTGCEAKLNEFGLKSAIGPSAVPAKLADCGLPGAVSLTAMLAVRDPAAVGVKVTLAVQLPLAGKELPQLLI